MRVLKFGGSSVADATRISRVLDIVEAEAAKDRVILVCSAISGCTDCLIRIGGQRDAALRSSMIAALRARHSQIVRRLFTGEQRRQVETELDSIFEDLSAAKGEQCVPFGEILSTRIIARKLNCEQLSAFWLDSRRLVKTDGGKLVEELSYKNIRAAIKPHSQTRVFVAPGFIASELDGTVSTLGRGGSDYSAALYAAAVGADSLQIWTDVPGIMTANPRQVSSAVTVPTMSYASALSLAENGAKVLYAPTLGPAMSSGIAIEVRNSFDPSNAGTIVCKSDPAQVETWVGVTSTDDPGSGLSTLCLVSEAVRVPEIACERMLACLQENGVRVEGKPWREGDAYFARCSTAFIKEALCAVHREFFENASLGVIDVFLAGYGGVGRSFVSTVTAAAGRIASRTGKSIRIVGVSNSRSYMIDPGGISPEQLEQRLRYGKSAQNYAFIDEIETLSARKAVFVDCTDSHDIHLRYEGLMRRGINIVTSNRRSLAVPYAQYASMKATARENGVFFRYDTTVGNALPILESIAGRANCSDSIVAIEAVISCTLNQIISRYDGSRGPSFASLLREAHESALTEPDPRTDLGGKDVLRKLLILSREAGVPLEASDVEISPMLPPEFFDCGIDEFFAKLEAWEQNFIDLEDELDGKGMRQRFVATLRRDKTRPLGYRAEIKMQHVDPSDPFYWVTGTENVTVIRSEQSAPLIIRGAGEGTRLAASGIIRDLLQ